MAQSIEEIKAGLPPVGNSIVNGVEVELSEEEKEATLNTWAENELARQLDEEANGYKVARQSSYPPLAEQFDKLWHDINNGTLDNTGVFFTALKEVKDNNPKPGE
jgi:hypothetical protein